MNQSLSYRHTFHAGNFADVHKHAALALLLRAMGRKDKPFLYLETHAGGGRYDLYGPDADRSREWEDGIGRLWARNVRNPSPQLAPYLAAISALNPNGHLRHYPGSPLIADACLRPMDRMVLLEARYSEAQRLETMFGVEQGFDSRKQRPAVQVRIGDGYAALQPWLPPPERRGVIFIDPPFERNDEFKKLLAALTTVERHFATGTVAVWYPLKDRAAVTRFHRALKESGLRRLLLAELRVLPDDVGGRFHGSALLLHNPPWQLEQELSALGKELATLLASGPGTGAAVRWLVGE
ncbi:Ribosomal RNA large subunit methyltransferase J [Gammaproteobacteria bacterium]